MKSLVKRFIDNLKRKKKNQDLILHNYIIAEELDCVLKLWIKDNQKTLVNDGHFDNFKKSLFLQIDGEGIYRSMGRIIKAELPYDTKVPIMLCTKHKLAELIVLDVHEKNMHVGVKHSITQLRRKFWITRARSFVKKLLKCCVKCNRYNSRSYKYPSVSELPSYRVEANVPFKSTGVDYFGPLYCKDVYEDSDMFKCFVVLYTCASTRGIILDLVADGYSKMFINSLRNFIARRGCPELIISDNGKSFCS